MYQLIGDVFVPITKRKRNLTMRQLAKERGELLYFTGNPCPKGHNCGRFVSTCNCKLCQQETTKKNHRKHLLGKYKITEQQYNEMLWSQNGKCAICKQEEKIIDYKTGKIKTLSIDHCHNTKKVRGLLCNNCNQGIGLLNHNAELLRKAALYCEEA